MNDEQFYEMFDKYGGYFEEPFPMMEYQDWSTVKMYSVMEECLRKKKPVQLLYPRDIEHNFY